MNETHQPNILVAEDEEHNRKAILRSLELRGYGVFGAEDGKAAQLRLLQNQIDLIILDIRMPDMDGIQLMDWMRENNIRIPVIILTAYATIESAIAGVKAGAVDYLVKPQSIHEIHAVIERVLKTTQAGKNSPRLLNLMEEALHILKSNQPSEPTAQPIPEAAAGYSPSQLVLQESELTLVINDQLHPSRVIPLTVHQLEIMQFFLANPNLTLRCKQIATQALKYENISEDEARVIVRPQILRLRRKIELNPDHPEIIVTVRGGGYRLVA